LETLLVTVIDSTILATSPFWIDLPPLFGLLNPITMLHPFTEKQVCIPLDPSVRYDPFYRVQLPANEQELTIRPFCVPEDLPAIYSWIHAYSGATGKDAVSPVPQLLETYTLLLTSDYSQSFIAAVNNKPLVQFDVISAGRDDISLEQQIQPGDYSFHFLFSPFFTQPPGYFTEAMGHCLKSLAPFPEIRCLLCKSYGLDKRSNRLLQDTGFVLNKQARERTGEINIYRYNQLAAVAE
jgi:hypothetical protein